MDMLLSKTAPGSLVVLSLLLDLVFTPGFCLNLQP
jgi:hypothetical protein